MQLTSKQLTDAAAISTKAAELWIRPINKSLAACDIRTPSQAAMWIAQCGHESGGFARLVESLNYSPEGLLSTWPSRYGLHGSSRFGMSGIARTHGRSNSKPADERAIANFVYGDRLGNDGPDDGWNYRGRGLIQVTGKDNYRECGLWMRLPLVAHPELLEDREAAALSTAWYWQTRGLLGVSDVAEATKRINGGTNGLTDRLRRYAKALDVLSRGELRRVSP